MEFSIENLENHDNHDIRDSNNLLTSVFLSYKKVLFEDFTKILFL